MNENNESKRTTRRQYIQTIGAATVVGAGAMGRVKAQTAGGDELWRFETPSGVTSSPTVVDGTVFVGNDDGTVYAVDAAQGTEQWRFQTGARVPRAPMVVDGTVFVGNYDNTLYAVDAAQGTEQWRFRTGGRVDSSPMVVNGTVFVGTDEGNDGTLYAVDATDGTEQWRLKTVGRILSPPTVVDGTVFVGSDDGNLYAVATGDGTEQWRFQTNGRVRPSPTVMDETVFVAGFGGTLYAVDAVDGAEQWRFQIGGFIRSSPTVVNGTVFVGSHRGTLYAVDVTTGNEQWMFRTGDRVKSSPTVADGLVFVGSHDSFLYALGASNGVEQWAFQTGADVISSPTLVDGTVFVGSGDGNLYSVDAGVEGLSEGSRVMLGSLGHHGQWRYAGQPLSSNDPDGDDEDTETGAQTAMTYEFNDGLEGWQIGQRKSGNGATPGSGNWSSKHGGSICLTADGAPSSVQAWIDTNGLQKGTTIRAEYEPTGFVSAAGTALMIKANDTGFITIDKDSQNEDGVLQGTLEQDYPSGTDILVHLAIWPGSETLYFTSVDIVPPNQTTSNKPPQAGYSTTPSPPIAGNVVTFDGSASADPDGSIGDYQWFIDGARYSNQTIKHTFESPGTYTVELTITDDTGATDTIRREITVVAPTTETLTTETQMTETPSTETPTTTQTLTTTETPATADLDRQQGAGADATTTASGVSGGSSDIPILTQFGDSGTTLGLGVGVLAVLGGGGYLAYRRTNGEGDDGGVDETSTVTRSATDSSTEPAGATTGRRDEAFDGGASGIEYTVRRHVSEDTIDRYRGELTSVDGPVDVLTVPETASRSVADAFGSRARIWRSLGGQANIVEVVRVDDEPRPWLAHESLDDLDPLSDVVHRMDVEDVVAVVDGIAEALRNATLYNHNHHDLRPECVHLDLEAGTCKVSDWGLVRSLEKAQGTERVTRFTAPEQLRPGETTDLQTDIYAVGALAYFGATGTRPYVGTTPMDSEIPTTPFVEANDMTRVPDPLRDPIEQATALNPDDRFGTVASLQGAFRNIL